ncbi:MAG: tRNA (adenosine(37)-N6)-threonylcarbamoyltransferase complex dimerization subunit type 1 TsaB [Verrucomicrobiota bacterium]|jgi:tRNA threonylcarbamoyladenosine biosynthesis protein TsaB
MITLAFDTSTTRGTVAVLDNDRLVGEEFFGRDGLFDAIERLQPGNFELLVVGVGPGSFTGIRAGLAAAKGLALPRTVPIRAVNSFDVLALTALPALPATCRQMCVIGDARRGEIYSALYDCAGKPKRACQLGTLSALTSELREPTWLLSAEMDRYVAQLSGEICTTPVFPSAAVLGRLGLAGPSTLPLEPIYLRVPEYRTVPVPA